MKTRDEPLTDFFAIFMLRIHTGEVVSRRGIYLFEGLSQVSGYLDVVSQQQCVLPATGVKKH